MISIERFNAPRSGRFHRTRRSGNDHAIGAAASTRAIAALLWALSATPALADTVVIVDQPLPNGDFANGLAEWTVEVSPDPATPPGTVEVVGGAARIVKGGAFHAGLSQTFDAPAGVVALRLRLAELPQFASDGGFIPESFDIHVLGAAGVSRAATFRADASAAANASAVPGGFNLGPGVTLNGATLRIPLDGIGAGEALTLSAALVGASSDTTTLVAIDDVVLEVEQKQPPPDPPGPLNADACELFRGGFEARRGVGTIPRCALGQVGDTGITACAGSVDGACEVAGLPGQDAESGRDAEASAGILEKLDSGPAGFDFTRIGPDGEILPASATEWTCVADNHSGLMWEVHVDDPSDPRHFGHSWSWLETDGQTDGGLAGTADGGTCAGAPCDTEGKVQAINDAALCGSGNWRMPTREELAGLVHAGQRDPAIAIGHFPFTDGTYWTDTPMAAQPDSAWVVDFVDGAAVVELKSTGQKVRLVREIP
ncbi:DUF1566 domain-containing protein [Wenzhouxiangella sp. XN79A]|uniref:Lcl C-terminal domain-containing protein n=1 Tax=Wenzhouxiangella sp. XN79A TaxID=2724193 RepID=UPI00144A6AF0|nr:DUF1566 domain-containing protein [Wenzhouxiangella sp. XN79A]NKI34150.1 DUF1566 domain-containing protein [Wenzhouxiangella sp. XN79A]